MNALTRILEIYIIIISKMWIALKFPKNVIRDEKDSILSSLLQKSHLQFTTVDILNAIKLNVIPNIPVQNKYIQGDIYL